MTTVGGLIHKKCDLHPIFTEFRPIKDSAPALRGLRQPSHYLRIGRRQCCLGKGGRGCQYKPGPSDQELFSLTIQFRQSQFEKMLFEFPDDVLVARKYLIPCKVLLVRGDPSDLEMVL